MRRYYLNSRVQEWHACFGSTPPPTPPFLKLVTIMLEAWNLVRKYTHMFSFRKYTFWYQDPLNFADVSIHFSKISIFWQKYYLYSKQEYESCVGDFLVLFSCFVRWKVTINENVRLKKYASGIWLPDGFKLALNWKKDNDVTIYQHSLFSFFLTLPVTLVKFIYWSKFHANIMSGSGIMTNYQTYPCLRFAQYLEARVS